MIWRILADLLVILHLAFAAFVVLGGFLACSLQMLEKAIERIARVLAGGAVAKTA